MNTNMTEFRWFSKICVACSHGIGQVNLLMLSLRGGFLDAPVQNLRHLLACPLVAVQETKY